MLSGLHLLESYIYYSIICNDSSGYICKNVLHVIRFKFIGKLYY